MSTFGDAIESAKRLGNILREVTRSLGDFSLKRGTEADRANAIAAARERLARLRGQSFRGDQLGSAAQAERFELELIERLERGDAFLVNGAHAK